MKRPGSRTYTKKILYTSRYIYIYIQSGIIVCFKRFGLMSIWIIEAISHGKLHMCPSISIDWLYIYIYKEAGMHLHKAQERTFLIAHSRYTLYVCSACADIWLTAWHDCCWFQTKQSRQVFEKGRAILSTLP